MRNPLRYLVHAMLIPLSVSHSWPNYTLEQKIVGGRPVEVHRFPSAVQFFNMGSLCAGTILNSWTVLTAAHCFDVNKNVADMIVQVGAKYVYDQHANVYEVFSYDIHKDYNKLALFSCDIGLVFVDSPIKLGNQTKKAILVNHGRWMNRKEKRFTATGWGWTKYGGPISEQGLMMTNLEYVSAKECGRMHGLRLTSDMFCLYGGGVRDTCKGDSGGGILWNNMVVGITSHGDGCANRNKPSVYANVWYFRNWIRKNVESFINQHCWQEGDKKLKKVKI